jgi:hypothetical protein
MFFGKFKLNAIEASLQHRQNNPYFIMEHLQTAKVYYK